MPTMQQTDDGERHNNRRGQIYNTKTTAQEIHQHKKSTEKQ